MSSATDTLAAQAQAMMEAIRAGCADPADAIRILGSFLTVSLPVMSVPSEIAAQALTSALFRRAALASMALASADYQPSSSTEANAMITTLSAIFDTEIVAAADAGQDASFDALRDLQHAVIADLRARSAALPELIIVRLPGNLPSLRLAYRLYLDTTREPGMVARADVIHPGFMPGAFEALSA